jgi:hypothetical protein
LVGNDYSAHKHNFTQIFPGDTFIDNLSPDSRLSLFGVAAHEDTRVIFLKQEDSSWIRTDPEKNQAVSAPRRAVDQSLREAGLVHDEDMLYGDRGWYIRSVNFVGEATK